MSQMNWARVRGESIVEKRGSVRIGLLGKSTEGQLSNAKIAAIKSKRKLAIQQEKESKKKTARAQKRFVRKLKLPTVPGNYYFKNTNDLFMVAIRFWDEQGIALVHQEKDLKRSESKIVHEGPREDRKAFLAKLRETEKHIQAKILELLPGSIEDVEDHAAPSFAIGWCAPPSLCKSFALLTELRDADMSSAPDHERQVFAKLQDDFDQEIKTLYKPRPIFKQMITAAGSLSGGRAVNNK